MLNKFLISGIIILGTASYFLYNRYEAVKADNVKLEFAIVEQRAVVNEFKHELQLQTEALKTLSKQNQEIEAEKERYLSIFKRHNLTKLAAAKPGLIAPRINRATKEVFDGIENDSRNIAKLDN
jgi:uncharacterized membrane protein